MATILRHCLNGFHFCLYLRSLCGRREVETFFDSIKALAVQAVSHKQKGKSSGHEKEWTHLGLRLRMAVLQSARAKGSLRHLRNFCFV